VADDQVLVLEALAQALGAIPGFEIVGLVNDSDNVISTAARVLPTVTVLNMGMMVCDSLGLAKRLRKEVPSSGIAVIAAQPTRALVDKAVEAGALSVVPKNARLTKLVGAVRGVGRNRFDAARIAYERGWL
jgi:two-component system, NarL family, response regulator DesR